MHIFGVYGKLEVRLKCRGLRGSISGYNCLVHSREIVKYMLLWAQKFLYVQLFLTLCSLPFLLWWGLPLSCLTLIGNLIFNPLAVLFLAGSACLFFSELLGMPSSLWVCILEMLTELWLWLLSWGGSGALIALPCPAWWMLVAIPCITLLIHRYGTGTLGKRLLFLVLFFTSLAFYLKIGFCPRSGDYLFPGGKKGLKITYDGKRVVLIDQEGVLRNGKGLPRWVDCTLRPFLVKNFGRLTLDAIELQVPTEARKRAALVIANRLGMGHSKENSFIREGCL